MIFYLDKLVDWNRRTGLSELERQVKEEIEQIRSEFFSENSPQLVRLIYPKGAAEKVHHVHGVLRKFPIDLLSPDGVWRYSKSRPKMLKSGKLDYGDRHLFVLHTNKFSEKDIELIWYLKNKASSLKNGKVYIENLEAEAKQQVEEMSTEADIRYMIMGNTSPVAKNEKLIKEAAEIFGVKDVDKMKINQIKMSLYDKIVEGEKAKDRFANFNKFEEIVEGNVKRKAAFITRRAINDSIVGYRDRAWWIKEGREYVEKLINIRPVDVEQRVELLIEEVINNPNIRSRLFAVMGESENTTVEELWELDRPTLMRHAKDRGLPTSTKSTKTELVEMLCKDMEIEFKPESA
jgi:hypothetical protein